jgi:pimeloyl-ACP methyl ester carboxylesterase
VAEWAYNGLDGETTLMARAVTCASGASAQRRARVRAESAWSLFGDPFGNLGLDPAYCAVLGTAPLGDDFREPIWSAVPALFISGELDANTPPFNAAEVGYGFPNGVHLLVRYGGHETLPTPVVQDAVRDFFAGQDVRGRALAAERPRYLTVAEARVRPCGPRGC